ncbi:MAG: hypothetical protein ABSA39_10045 [Edaphobacter sp.]
MRLTDFSSPRSSIVWMLESNHPKALAWWFTSLNPADGFDITCQPLLQPVLITLSGKYLGRYDARDASGEPGPRDRGLNNTHTWGRTHWAERCFANEHGLQDALRAIVASGGTIDKEWPLPHVLQIGDQATGTKVLEEMYARWSETLVPVDLPELWDQLGLHKENTTIKFDSKAPLATIRVAITDHRKLNVVR